MLISDLYNFFINDDNFINNEYLNLYIKLIEENLNNEKINKKTQAHHCIPKCYFKNKGYDYSVSLENRNYINSNNIIINVNHKTHIKLHYYLSLFSKGKLKIQLEHAFFAQLNSKYAGKIDDLDKLQEVYEHYLENYSNTLIKKNGVICIELNKIYNDINDASIEFTGKKYNGTLYAACNGKQNTALGYHWCWLDDTNKINILLEKYYNKPRINYLTSVYCFELDMTFKSCRECSKYFKDNFNIKLNPLDCVKGISKTTKGYHFCKPEDKDTYNVCPSNDGRHIKEGKHVICLETGKEYISLGQATRETGISSIASCCNHDKRYPRAGGLHWCWKENYTMDYKKYIEELNNPKSETWRDKHRDEAVDKIICLETGKKYKYIIDAEEDMNIKVGRLKDHLRGVTKQVRNKNNECFHFKYL